MCAWLEVSRSGYYAWRGAEPSQRSKDDSALIAVMKNIYTGRGESWGAPDARGPGGAGPPGVAQACPPADAGRWPARAPPEGVEADHHRRGQASPGPGPDRPGFTAAVPDTKWCGDVTYIKTWDGWAYLATVIDLYSRKVIGWAVAAHMRASLVTAALEWLSPPGSRPPV